MAASAMTSDMTKMTVNEFDSLHAQLASKTFSADVVTTHSGDNISIIWVPPTRSNIFIDKIHETLKCNTCRSWLCSFGRMRFKDGETPFSFLEDSESVYYQMAHADLSLKHQWKLVDAKVIGIQTAGVNPATGKEWNHFSATLTDETVGKYETFSKSDYNWYFNQKLPILSRMVRENAGDGILDSLNVLLSNLEEIPYGNKLEASTKWFYGVMEKYLTKYHGKGRGYRKETLFFMKCLVDCPLLAGSSSERIIFTHLKQVKDHVLDVLASAGSIPELKALLKSRFSPTTYMRPTVAPSMGQLERAMKDFAGFRTTIMTIDELISTYGGVLVPQPEAVVAEMTAADCFKEMLAEKAIALPKRRMAGSFAARAGVRGGLKKFPKSFRALMAQVDKYPGLMVSCTRIEPIILTTYPKECRHMFKHEHLWGFQLGKTVKMFDVRVRDFSPVSALSCIDRHAFVGLSLAKVTDSNVGLIGNTCFPEFLHPSIQRTHRAAFESLNKRLRLGVPDAPLMIGVGSSMGSSTKLVTPLVFKYGGHEFVIDTL